MRRLGVTMVALQVVAAVAVAFGATAVPSASAAPAGASSFVALEPARILDTRQGGAAVPADGTLLLDVLGRGGVPSAGVNAVVVNLTATNTLAAGFVQALPSGVAPGGSSSLNVEGPGQTVANLSVVPLGGDGRIALYTQSGADLVVDVLGAFVASGPAAAGRYVATTPARVLDTRTGVGVPVAGPIGRDGTVTLRVAGVGGVPATGARAVALNLTMASAAGAGYVQVVPTGSTTPLGSSSNLNHVAGQTVANLVIVPVGSDGNVTLFTTAGGHLLADVTGWFTDESAPLGEDGLFVPTGPVRVLDTRDGRPKPGDGSFSRVDVLGQFGLPSSGVAALVGNITATEAAAPGFVQALPSDQPIAGLSSNLNVERTGQVLANAAVATLGGTQRFDLYVQSSTHLLYDVAGYFTGEPQAGSGGEPDPSPTTPTTPPPTTTPPVTPPPTTTPPPPLVPEQVGDVQVSTPLDFLLTGPRLAFSTKQNAATEAQPVTVRNRGSVTRAVTAITFAGEDDDQFRLAPGTPTSFTLAPGASRTINVLMAPSGRSTTTAMVLEASLVLTTNDPAGPTRTVALGGVKVIQYEGVFEPHLYQLTRIFGFATDVGFTRSDQAMTRLPVGDEVPSPYWKVADPSQPVQLIPLARYNGRGATNTSPTRWYRKGSSCGVGPNANCPQLYQFPATPPEIAPTPEEPEGTYTGTGGENQKVLPDATGTAANYAFNPGTSAFGLWGAFNYSDDGKNVYTFPPAEEGGPAGETVRPHIYRFYPARTPAGQVIPNAWLVGKDKFATTNPDAVNYDYQDEVFLMVNAQPELTAAGAPNTVLEFAGAVGGTLADRDGQGTGFTSAMASSNATAHRPELLDLDTAAGVLRIESTTGSASTNENSQSNALQVGFDGTRAPFTVSARILGPLPLTRASQHIGIYVGPNQDQFMKLEIEFRDGQCSLVLYREGSGDGGGLRPGTRGLGSCANLTSVDLNLMGDPATGAFTVTYRVNGGSLTQAFTSQANTVGDPQGFFSRQARAGVIVSSQQSGGVRPPVFTATFDRFTVTG